VVVALAAAVLFLFLAQISLISETIFSACPKSRPCIPNWVIVVFSRSPSKRYLAPRAVISLLEPSNKVLKQELFLIARPKYPAPKSVIRLHHKLRSVSVLFPRREEAILSAP